MSGKLERKEVVVGRLLQQTVEDNDWNLMNFILNKCWNKARIFNVRNIDGDNLLHQTCRRNNINSTRTLIEHGISVDVRNCNGDTSLHIAAEMGFETLLRLLFEAGANPFIVNKSGKQPIDIVQNNHIKEILRRYNIKCSETKLMKNLVSWKQLVAEEEKRDKVIKEYERNRKLSFQPMVTQTNLRRADSGIVSDADSDRSGSLLSVNSMSSVTSSYAQVKALKDKNMKLNKSKSFSVKDFGSQYAAVIRKLNSASKNSGCETTQQQQHHAKDLKVSPSYGYIKKTATGKRRRKIDRSQRNSMPEFPIFAPPESYI